MPSGVAAEQRKHSENDGKLCIPLVVETYGAWGAEAIRVFSIVASRQAVSTNSSKSRALAHLIWPSA